MCRRHHRSFIRALLPEGEELVRVATLARQIEDRLAGGVSSREWTMYILGLAILPLIAVLFVVF